MESRDHHGSFVQERPDRETVNFDTRPAGPYADQRPDYPLRKGGGGLGRIWAGIVVVAIILGVTWYAFRSKPATEDELFGEAPPAATQPADLTPRAPDGTLAEREADTTTFAPAQEASGDLDATGTSAISMDSSDSTGTSAISTDSSDSTGTSAVSADSSGSVSAGAAVNQAIGEQAAGAGTNGSRPPASPAAPAAEPAEVQPPVASSSAAQSQTAARPTDNRTSAPAVAPVAEPTAEPADGPSTAASDQAAASRPASVPAADISDFWVVNISSTTDEDESKRLLKRVDGRDLGGQMYFYQAMVNGRLHHRIRVGFFATKAEAEAVGEKIKTDFDLAATPWAVQPTVTEVKKYKE